jgi:signal transduction histidine kinase
VKIRARLLVFNLTMISATALILGTTFFFFAERYLQTLALREIHATSRQAVYMVENFFATRIAEQKNLSRSTFFFRELNVPAIESRFGDYRKFYEAYQTISFYGPDRIRRIDLNRTNIGRPGSPQNLFDQAEKSADPVIAFDLSNRLRPSLLIVTRLQAPGRPLVGFISATVPLIHIQQSLSLLGTNPIGHARADVQIYSGDGSLIFSRLETVGTNDNKILTDSLKEIENLAHSDKDPSSIEKDFSEESPKLVETPFTITTLYRKSAGSSEQSSWTLAYRVLKEDINRPIKLLRYMVLSLFIGLLSLTFMLNRWLSSSLLRPIEILTSKLQSFDLTASSPVLNDTDAAKLRERTDELGLLSRGLFEMMSRLRSNFAELSSSAKFAALGEMAAGVAHEINNPLTVILGKAVLVETTARSCETMSPSDGATKFKHSAHLVLESSQKIVDMVTRISKTIQALRSYARSGDLDPMGAETVSTIIDSTLEICHERLRLASINVQKDIQPEDAVILARPVHVSQILMNLLNNAHDALMANSSTTSNSTKISPAEKWIKVEVRETPSHVEISVLNGGPKISDEIADQIFQPFFTTKPQGSGTGIGLPISERLAKANHAELFYDRTSPFTRFCLRFPRPDLDLDRTPLPKTETLK